MKYTHIPQKPFCCVPASLSMILERRGVTAPRQDDIAYDLGVVLPPGQEHLLARSHKVPKPESGYGTRISLESYSLNAFFKKRKYALIAEFASASQFNTSGELREYMKKNVAEGRDQLVCFNQGHLKGEATFGHATVITRMGSKVVFMKDPEPGMAGKERRISLEHFLSAMQDHYKGGIWVISEKER